MLEATERLKGEPGRPGMDTKYERGRVKMEKGNQTMKSKDKKANEENVYGEDNILYCTPVKFTVR